LVGVLVSVSLVSEVVTRVARKVASIFAEVTEPSVGVRVSESRLSLVATFPDSAETRPVMELCARPPVTIVESVTEPALGVLVLVSRVSEVVTSVAKKALFIFAEVTEPSVGTRVSDNRLSLLHLPRQCADKPCDAALREPTC
jgi:hypothetical protein